MTHINIIDSYEPFYQVWTITPQEIWSDHQKGKMVIFRVLTAEGQFRIFNLANGKLGSKMVSRTQWHHLDLMTRFKKISKALDWQMNFPINWSKINCTLKSQTLTFWSKSSAKGHFSSRCVKTWNLFTKKPNFGN